MAGSCPTEEQYPLVFWAKKANSFKPSAKKNLSVAYHPSFTVIIWCGVVALRGDCTSVWVFVKG